MHLMRKTNLQRDWAEVLGWMCWLVGLAAFAGAFGNPRYNAGIWVALAIVLLSAGNRLPARWRIFAWGLLAVGGVAFFLHVAGVLQG